MTRMRLVAWAAALVLTAGCGDKKQEGDADADDTTEVAGDTADDTTADPVPDTVPDVAPDTEPDPGEDPVEEPVEDSTTDPAGDALEDPGDDPALDPSDEDVEEEDASTDTGSEAPGSCVTLDPTAYGMCDMVLGVGWDGSACVWISGCSCVPDCAYFFSDMTSCRAACP